MNVVFTPPINQNGADRRRWILRRPRLTLTFVFIFSICFSVWIPLSLNVGGLNLRASQVFLPFVFLALISYKNSGQVLRSNMPLVIAGLVLWGAFLFWTMVNLELFTSSVKPLGHVFLLGLNLLHLVAVYWLVISTRQWRGAVTALVVSVTLFNLLMISTTIGAGLQLPFFKDVISTEGGTALVGGNLVATTVMRFTFSGVPSGIMSAAALLIVAGIFLTPQTKPARWLWFVSVVNAMGLVVGFSRQNVVSLAGGMGVIAFYLFLRKRLQRLKRMALLIPILMLGILIINQLPGGQLFSQAFLGRTLELFQPDAYTSQTTVGSRLQLWSGMWNDVKQNPFWGFGQDAYLKYHRRLGDEGSHNFPLEVLHSSGLIGFFGYGILHLLILLQVWRGVFCRLATEADRYLLLGLLAAAIALWLSTLTNLIFTTPVYWAVLGMALASSRLTCSVSRVVPVI